MFSGNVDHKGFSGGQRTTNLFIIIILKQEPFSENVWTSILWIQWTFTSSLALALLPNRLLTTHPGCGFLMWFLTDLQHFQNTHIGSKIRLLSITQSEVLIVPLSRTHLFTNTLNIRGAANRHRGVYWRLLDQRSFRGRCLPAPLFST